MADAGIGGYCIFPVTLLVFPYTRSKATGQILINPDLNHDAAKTIANAVPHAQLRTLEGQRHDVSAEAIAPVLVEFFNS